jgi:hypothetical protein
MTFEFFSIKILFPLQTFRRKKIQGEKQRCNQTGLKISEQRPHPVIINEIQKTVKASDSGTKSNLKEIQVPIKTNLEKAMSMKRV